MSRTVVALSCLAAYALSAFALCAALAVLHNRGLGFGFAPYCLLPAFVIAAALGAAVVKKKERALWFVVPTIGASAVLLSFAQFLHGWYQKHGPDTGGGGGGIIVLILIGLGVLLAAIYGISTAGIFLRPTNKKEANQALQRNAGSRPSSGDSSASETPSSLGPRG